VSAVLEVGREANHAFIDVSHVELRFKIKKKLIYYKTNCSKHSSPILFRLIVGLNDD
jgi:hypothetical protein